MEKQRSLDLTNLLIAVFLILIVSIAFIAAIVGEDPMLHKEPQFMHHVTAFNNEKLKYNTIVTMPLRDCEAWFGEDFCADLLVENQE